MLLDDAHSILDIKLLWLIQIYQKIVHQKIIYCILSKKVLLDVFFLLFNFHCHNWYDQQSNSGVSFVMPISSKPSFLSFFLIKLSRKGFQTVAVLCSIETFVWH